MGVPLVFRPTTRSSEIMGVTESEAFDRLLRRLDSVRLETARELAVPPYVVFHDATLREMARLRPTSLDDFRAVKGVGARKAYDLGERFLSVIRYDDYHPTDTLVFRLTTRSSETLGVNEIDADEIWRWCATGYSDARSVERHTGGYMQQHKVIAGMIIALLAGAAGWYWHQWRDGQW